MSWRQPRWAYMPKYWRLFLSHWSPWRFYQFLPGYLVILVAKDWQRGWQFFGNGIDAITIASTIIFAGVLHIFIGCMTIPFVALHWLLPPRVHVLEPIRMLLVGGKCTFDGVGFERTRLVIFSPKIIRLRAFAAGKSVVAGVPPDVDLEELTQILPGPVQVWNAMDKKRYVAPGIEPTPVGD